MPWAHGAGSILVTSRKGMAGKFGGTGGGGPPAPDNILTLDNGDFLTLDNGDLLENA